jgi:hypothetical protein
VLAVLLRNTQKRFETLTSIDDGWIHDISSGSMMIRLASSASLMLRSDKITTQEP